MELLPGLANQPRLRPTAHAARDGRPAGCATPGNLEVGARNASAPPWEGRMVPFGSPERHHHRRAQHQRSHPEGAARGPAVRRHSHQRHCSTTRGRSSSTTSRRRRYTAARAPATARPAWAASAQVRRLVSRGAARTTSSSSPTASRTSIFARLRGRAPDRPSARTRTSRSTSCTSSPTDRAARTPSRPSSSVSRCRRRSPTGLRRPSIAARSPQAATRDHGGHVRPQGSAATAPRGPELRRVLHARQDRLLREERATRTSRTTPPSSARRCPTSSSGFAGSSTSRTCPVFASARLEQLVARARSSVLLVVRRRHGARLVAPACSSGSGPSAQTRTTCGKDHRPAGTQPIDNDKGDSFSTNVNSADSSHPRGLLHVDCRRRRRGKRLVGAIDPSLDRPRRTPTARNARGHARTATTPPSSLPMVPRSRHVRSRRTTAPQVPRPRAPTIARTKFLKWEIGVDPQRAPHPIYTRRNVFGAIYHSTPTMVGAPNEFLRDESYTQFTVEQQCERPPMLYTATTDGQLHAFKVGEVRATRPNVHDRQEGQQRDLVVLSARGPAAPSGAISQHAADDLDGAPVVKDVVFVQERRGREERWRRRQMAHRSRAELRRRRHRLLRARHHQARSPRSGDATTGPQVSLAAHHRRRGQPIVRKAGGTPVITTLFFKPRRHRPQGIRGGDSSGAARAAGPPERD